MHYIFTSSSPYTPPLDTNEWKKEWKHQKYDKRIANEFVVFRNRGFHSGGWRNYRIISIPHRVNIFIYFIVILAINATSL